MKNKFLIVIVFSICLIAYTSCDDNKDDGSRGFMSNATIIGDSQNGYACYLDGGGLVISYDSRLANVERGYFSFSYMEDDWTTSVDGTQFINNARVSPWTVYDVIHPVDKDEFEDDPIVDKEVPSLLGMGYGYRGYFNLHGGVGTVNLVNGEKIPATLNLVYDADEQTPDTLKLQLYCNLNIPSNWSKTTPDYSAVSCDISGLATLQSWNDTVTIQIRTSDEKEYYGKISKVDFIKSELLVER